MDKNSKTYNLKTPLYIPKSLNLSHFKILLMRVALIIQKLWCGNYTLFQILFQLP